MMTLDLFLMFFKLFLEIMQRRIYGGVHIARDSLRLKHLSLFKERDINTMPVFFK